GHVPRSVTAGEVSDAGQKSIEHLSGVVFAASTREAEVQTELVVLRKALAEGANYLSLLRRLEAKYVDTYSEEKAAALFARFKKNGTWQSPTLVTMRGGAFLDDPNFTNDPRLKYLPQVLRTNWEPKNNNVYRTASASDYAAMKKVFYKQLEMVRAMRGAGVEFLASTDVSNPYCFPGFSLHDELALLVKAGLTPMEALQAATRNPAKYLGLLDSLGTVEKGKIADLVLLDANPLAEIGNTKRINAVVVGGKLIPKLELEAMLAKVEATANQK
ncbi:MAG: amidohydrolase family protein, partial [Pyrinomonadaceae bacterium]